MIKECSIAEAHNVIEQGTIIKFENKDIQYGIIVTADCDIFQNKYGDFLSYCPIVTLEKYILDILIPKLCKRKLDKLLGDIKDSIKKEQGYENISDDAFLDLLSYIKNENIETFKNDLRKKIFFYNKFSTVNEFNINTYKELCNSSPKEFANIIRNFPGDSFYINRIPHDNREGFVINLRRIAEIKKEEIVVYFSPVGKLPSCYIIGKLNSPYKEKMTQTLGDMFSAIGYSLEYENIRDENIKTIAGELIK